MPDRTFLLLLDPGEARSRMGDERDRMERAGDEFRLRVDAAYRELAGFFPQRIVTVDASLPVDVVARLVRGALESAVAP